MANKAKTEVEETTQKYKVVGTDAWINHAYYKEGALVELTTEDYLKRKKILVPVKEVSTAEPIETNKPEDDEPKLEGDK